MTNSTAQWQGWIDRGGTFTDVVAKRPDGALVSHKLLSENPERYKDAAVQGIRDLLGLKGNADIPEGSVSVVKMGTTVATNALPLATFIRSERLPSCFSSKAFTCSSAF